MEEKISVIMSIYKEPKDQLKSSIESILNQTYSNIEYIIILDNPDEEWRKEFVESYHDSRIKFYVNEKNMGLTKSLNKAISYATGKYIARMDADDISLENRLKKQLEFMKENNLDLCGSNIEYFYDNGSTERSSFPSNYSSTSKVLKYYNCVPHPTWLVKKEVYESNNNYRDISTCEDYDFLIRAALKHYKIANYPGILLRYRMTLEGISRTNACKQEILSILLKKYYKKGRELPIEVYNDFYNSDKFQKKLDKYNEFRENNYKRKNTKNIFKKVWYCLLLLTNVTVLVEKIKKFKDKRAR